MKKSLKPIISILTMITFLGGMMMFSSCGGSKKGHAKVKSGSGMGNKKHRNKHVWGK